MTTFTLSTAPSSATPTSHAATTDNATKIPDRACALAAISSLIAQCTATRMQPATVTVTATMMETASAAGHTLALHARASRAGSSFCLSSLVSSSSSSSALVLPSVSRSTRPDSPSPMTRHPSSTNSTSKRAASRSIFQTIIVFAPPSHHPFHLIHIQHVSFSCSRPPTDTHKLLTSRKIQHPVLLCLFSFPFAHLFPTRSGH